jgi:DUF438 domain-containing protein
MPDLDTLDLCAALLESLPEPIVLCDTAHIIRYVNPAGLAKYAKWGDIRGRNLLDCHNEASRAILCEILEAFRAGETERLYGEYPTKRAYMRAVRDAAGTLVGYYERFEYLTSAVSSAG